jgi:asparagine N-glycosylation enzyme membrane subunit Stt3
MIFRLLADLTLVVHFAFVVFVVLGGLLALRWPRAAFVHVPVAVYGAAIEFIGFICPLTPLEVSLRRRGGQAGFEGGFIEHYITAALYPTGLTREIQLVLGALVIVVNIVIYAVVWRRARRVRSVDP